MDENRIGWTNSVDMPSHIHRTIDGGKTTVCGHSPQNNKRWKITDKIPRKIKGQSNYCKICFRDGGKTLAFITGL